MKILKSQLQTIIKEEHNKLLNELEQQAGVSATPEDGKYYEYKHDGDFVDSGKYVEGKGFVRVEHEDFYKRAGIEPHYEQGTVVKQLTPEEAAKQAARKIGHAEAVEKYSIRND